MLFPVRDSALYGSIYHIISLCSYKHMIRIDARRIVAGVAQKMAGWNRAESQFISKSMSRANFSLKISSAVPGCFRCVPDSTRQRIAYADLRPEVCDRIRNSAMTSKPTIRFSLYLPITFACLFTNCSFSPTSAMAIAIRNFQSGINRGILAHVNSSFVAVGLAAGRSNVAVAFC